MARAVRRSEHGSQTSDGLSVLFLRAFLILAGIGLIFWQAMSNGDYYLNIWAKVLGLLGLGIFLLPPALLAALIVFRRYPHSLLRRWNRWLGAFGLSVAIWGTLGLIHEGAGVLEGSSLGGVLGMWIAGASILLALAKLTALYLASLWLLFPRLGSRVFTATVRGAVFGLWMGFYYLWGALVLGVHASSRLLVRLTGRATKDKNLRQLENEHAVYEANDMTKSKALGPGENDPEKGSLVNSSGASSTIALSTKPSVESSPKGIWERFSSFKPAGTSSEKRSLETLKKASAPVADNSVGQSTSPWRLPPIEVLEADKEIKPDGTENERRARAIEETLKSFGVDAQVVEINPGPTVTQFGVEPGWVYKYREVRGRGPDGRLRRDKNGEPLAWQELVSKTRVRVDTITSREKDLALALAAPSIRIEAPVPGKSVIGIEVPNSSFNVVALRGVIQSSAFQRIKAKSTLAIALGRGSGGEEVVADLEQMPHALIAGATGSGKSVCLSSILACLLMHNSPDDLRLVLVDPKRVEMVSFNGVPHLQTPVVTNMERVPEILDWAIREMDERYSKFNAAGARNIAGYNRVRPQTRLPYIVIAIDELADLMLSVPVDVESKIIRLAQLGRATGIHLVLATQRPSVDVITGLIKANFPTRISFAVSSLVDSRVILDSSGAEKLLGRGDMLYQSQEAQKPKRLQGTYLSDKEIERLVNFWLKQKSARLYTEPIEKLAPSLAAELQEEHGPAVANKPNQQGEDPLVTKARELALQYDKISTNLIQRKLSVGFPKASRLLEALESEGVVAPGEPGKSRDVIARKKGLDKGVRGREQFFGTSEIDSASR